MHTDATTNTYVSNNDAKHALAHLDTPQIIPALADIGELEIDDLTPNLLCLLQYQIKVRQSKLRKETNQYQQLRDRINEKFAELEITEGETFTVHDQIFKVANKSHTSKSWKDIVFELKEDLTIEQQSQLEQLICDHTTVSYKLEATLHTPNN